MRWSHFRFLLDVHVAELVDGHLRRLAHDIADVMSVAQITAVQAVAVSSNLPKREGTNLADLLKNVTDIVMQDYEFRYI